MGTSIMNRENRNEKIILFGLLCIAVGIIGILIILGICVAELGIIPMLFYICALLIIIGVIACKVND